MSGLDLVDPARLARLTSSSKPSWVFDVDRHAMIWANKAGLSFWCAATMDQLLARDFSSDNQIVRARLQRIVEAGSAQLTEHWMLYPDGTPTPVLLTCTVGRAEQDHRAILFAVECVIHDGIDPASWRLLEAARTTALLVSSFDLDGRLVVQNPAADACYGVPGEGVGDTLHDRVLNPAVARQILSRVEAGERLSWETAVQTRSGRQIHRISARRARDPVTGSTVSIVSEEDVTELAALRKELTSLNQRLEQQVNERTERLRKSEERYELAVRSAAIWDWDIQTGQIFVSPNALQEIGFSQREFDLLVQSQALVEIVHPDDRTQLIEAFTAHIEDPRQPFLHEARIVLESEEHRWLRAQGHCVVDEGGQSVRSVGLLTDITERKELEESLMVAQRMEAVGQLTGGIAHDFNNLLTVVQGNAELLSEMYAAPDHQQTLASELVREILDSSARGAALTRQLLAFSRKQTLSPATVDLGALVSGMRSNILRTFGGSISVRTQVQPDLWPVFADPTQVETAILGIALNARDAMPTGGEILIACANRRINRDRPVSGAALAPGMYVEVSVTDTGLGMDEETRAKAFEPFFTTKGVGEGSGLGLSMVMGFSRQSGGDVRIQSQPGQGTTVSILLPRSSLRPQGEHPPERAADDEGPLGHVLILEDDARVRQTISMLVRSLGYDVTEAETAQEALQMIDAFPRPDLILADVMLSGGESGYDLAKQLHSVGSDTRVILISGFPGEPDRSDENMAQLQLLPKPVDKFTLADAIQRELARPGQ